MGYICHRSRIRPHGEPIIGSSKSHPSAWRYRQALQPARVVLCGSRGLATMLGGRQTDQCCRLPPDLFRINRMIRKESSSEAL